MTVGSMAIGSLAVLCGTEWAVALDGRSRGARHARPARRVAARLADTVGAGLKPALTVFNNLRCG